MLTSAGRPNSWRVNLKFAGNSNLFLAHIVFTTLPIKSFTGAGSPFISGGFTRITLYPT